MDFFINEFSILSPSSNKAFNQKFSKNINLIVGVKDSGKSSLARSILYTLGCDVRSLDFLTEMPNNIYILDFSIGINNYILIRKKLKKGKGKNYFRIIINNSDSHSYYDTKSFKEYLNEIMKIEVITRSKDKKETKFYPNHIFLPFYTDQDFSWQSYLSNTFNGINFIENYKKTILEYFTGARPNDYYSLQLAKTQISSELDELDALIKSKELIIEENIKNIHIIEDVDVDSFKTQYQYFLKIYNNIIETEHEIKKTINEKIYLQNSYKEMQKKIDSSVDNFIDSELSGTCPNCNQIVFKEMEENYKLFLMQENLINERDKVNMYLQEIEEDLSVSMYKLQELKVEDKEIEDRLNATSELVDLKERADSYALNRVNEKLEKGIDDLRIARDKKNSLLEEVQKSLNDLNNIDISTPYQKLMINAYNYLSIPFSYNNYYVSNLESVKISLSGATKVQAYIAQYLSIYEIISGNTNCINIPMFVDTFLKDDLNETELENTSTFIFESLKNKHQSFIFISNNEQTLRSINKFDFFQITLSSPYGLLGEDYDVVFDKYSKFIVG